MRLHRLVVAWAGSPVKGLAVNVLHFDATEQEAPPVAAVLAAYGALATVLTLNTGITVPSSGDTIEDTTGDLVDVWVGAGGGALVGTAGQNAAAGVGACVTWTTGAIVDARRLRGRTFLVPLSTAAYDSDGTLTGPGKIALENFTAALIGAGGLGVWHRPTTVGGADGTSSSVLSGKVRDRVAYLSSRRD